MNVLVTGITGFIGSRLATRLVEEGHQVNGLVRHSSERELSRLKKILPQIHLIEGDLVRYHSVLSAVEASDPEIVFHLGALTPVRLSFDDPYPYRGANFDGTSKPSTFYLEISTERETNRGLYSRSLWLATTRETHSRNSPP